MSNQACVSRCAELRNEYFDTHIEWHKENTKLEKTLKHQKRAAVVGGPQDAHVRVQNTRDKLDSLQRSKPVKPVPCHYCMRNSEKKKPVVNKDPVIYQKKLADTITAQNIEHGTRFYILNHMGSVVQCVAMCCSDLQCVVMCCSVLQCVVVYCSVLQCVAVWCSAMQCVAACCSVLQCVAAYCSVLQCVVVCYSML